MNSCKNFQERAPAQRRQIRAGDAESEGAPMGRKQGCWCW